MRLSDLKPGDIFIFSNCKENTDLYVRNDDEIFEAREISDYPKATRLSDGVASIWKQAESIEGDHEVILILK